MEEWEEREEGEGREGRERGGREGEGRENGGGEQAKWWSTSGALRVKEKAKRDRQRASSLAPIRQEYPKNSSSFELSVLSVR